MNWLKSFVLVIVLIVAFLVGALAVNQQEITLKFAIWETPFAARIYWWLLAALVIGFVLGAVNAVWMNVKHRVETRRLRRELDHANAELKSLRSAASRD